MYSCMTSSRIQLLGVRALRDLAADDARRPGVIANGGIEAVLKAMQGHQTASEVQEQDCFLLAYTLPVAKILNFGSEI